MPFKGDMRLGGRHSNVASLNGTASDFVSVPAYGTVLSGPTDTSRFENDFLGTQFYMPYSTTVYANGLGGQTSVETWGLQYYPAGWVTATSQNPLYVSWGPEELDGYSNTVLSGTWNYAMENLNHIEDGTGINYTAVVSTVVAESNGYIIASSQMGTGADRWRVVFSASGGYNFSAVIQDFSMELMYGTYVSSGSNAVNYAAPCQNFQIGVQYTTQYADGYGGSYSVPSGGATYDGASYLGHCGSQQNGWHFYHHDGSGNVTEGYAPSGFVLYSASSSSSFGWSAPDNTSGNYTYATNESTETASDNVGGISYGGSSWNAPNGQEIYAGSYTSGQDESGNDIIQYFTVNFTTHEYANDGGPYFSVTVV